MSLEEALRENTAAMQALALAIGSMQQSYPQATALHSKPQSQWTEAEVAQACALQKIEYPNEQKKSSPATSTSQPSSPESAPATYDDVKKLVIAISKTSRDKAVAALQRLGVGRATELKDHQWPAAVAYLTKVVAGEVDPESAHE